MSSLPLSLSLDCHFYDDKLSEQMKHMDRWLDTMYEKHQAEYLEPQPALLWLLSQQALTPKAKSMLELMNRDRSGNITMMDGEKWDVFILFSPLQWICARYSDLISILNEQLEDMVSGSCPQGRLYRIIQICMTISSDQ